MIGRWRERGGGGGVGRGAYTGMCRWQGIVFDLSVLNWVYNFVCESVNRVLLARLVSFARSILYNTKEMTITWICCNAFGNTAACILSFALNKVVKVRVLS